MSLSPFYSSLIDTARSLLSSPEHHHAENKKALPPSRHEWLVVLSNASSLIYHTLREERGLEINWAGFYLVYPDEDASVLRLGPFQGQTACLAIPFSKGVCGKCASTKETQLIPDVHAFPGHIACDSDSASEAVVPMIYKGNVVGLLDIDCRTKDAFGAKSGPDDEDKIGLEALVDVIMESVGEKGWW
jgi:L-methionine (R)-S-oxide reductase